MKLTFGFLYIIPCNKKLLKNETKQFLDRTHPKNKKMIKTICNDELELKPHRDENYKSGKLNQEMETGNYNKYPF